MTDGGYSLDCGFHTLCEKTHETGDYWRFPTDQLDGCDNKTATEFFLILDLTDPAVDAVPTS